MDSLHIRTYQNTDKENVKKLYELASIHSEIGYRSGPWEKDFDDIETYYSGGVFLVGTIRDEIITIGGLQKISADIAHIRRMRTHPAHRRKGFAKQVLEKLEEEARSNTFHELRLRTSTKQFMAQTFYENNGYTKVEAEKSFYTEGDGKSFQVIWYSKNLHR